MAIGLKYFEMGNCKHPLHLSGFSKDDLDRVVVVGFSVVVVVVVVVVCVVVFFFEVFIDCISTAFFGLSSQLMVNAINAMKVS
jgi:hypothetical protein